MFQLKEQLLPRSPWFSCSQSRGHALTPIRQWHLSHQLQYPCHDRLSDSHGRLWALSGGSSPSTDPRQGRNLAGEGRHLEQQPRVPSVTLL